MAKIVPPLERFFLRLSGGKFFLSSALGGLSMVTVITTGARTGRVRAVPLQFFRDGAGNLIVIASNWGQPKHPAWYHNLVAHPRVTCIMDGTRAAYTARATEGGEYDKCWGIAVAIYPGYNEYKRRVGDQRKIPVMVLEQE